MEQVVSRLRGLALAIGLVALTLSGQPRRASVPSLRVPLDIPLLLSGNFGELRMNHFHSGVDFKTQGRTGLPVYCAADGYVSRVVVSPWGFGRAVYVTHPTLGLTTVYGHLESFATRIDTPVRNRQYETESFRIDTQFEPGQIEVRRGELLGRSGNAGSSGGPHLHMDVRDAVTEHALDPLVYYRDAVKDDVRPEIRGIALYPRDGGMVDGGTKPVYHAGQQLGAQFTAWGHVTPAIKAYDRMTGTTNIYGVRRMTLTCDGDTVFNRVLNHIDFDRTRAVNTMVEYADVIDANSWYMITEQPEARPLSDIITTPGGDGSLYIDSERVYRLEFTVEDTHGNLTRQPFTIKGVKAAIPPRAGNGELIMRDRDNTISADDGATAAIPTGMLYNDEIIGLTSTPSTSASYVSRLYKVGDTHIPLAGNITLTVPLTNGDMHPDKRQYTMVRIAKGKPSAVESEYIPGGTMQAKVNRFGTYAIMIDTVAPKITPVAPEKWSARGKITYKISDNLSGIDTYRGEIDGKWIMLEFDGKIGTLSYKIDRKRVAAGRRRVTLTVTDAAGNRSTHTYKITI